jgi:O-antigen ligase
MPPHRFLVAVLLLGNAVAFAGVDPISRALTALVVVILIAGTRRLPQVPTSHRWAGLGLAVLVAAQLTIWPQALRSLLQPGYVAVMKAGWAPLSLAPWSTVQAAASIVVAGGVALACARMATARSGLPVLLGVLTATCALLSVLGFAGEAGAPDRVLLVRENTGGGSVYGPFVNRNHFAQAIELSLPAAVVLMAAGVRRFGAGGAARQRSAVMILAGAVTISVGCAAMLRSGSRGGVLFLVLGALMTLPLWRRPAGTRAWPWVWVLVVVMAIAAVLASTRLPAVGERFSTLLAVEGVEGNTRWDLWRGTWMAWRRAPMIGSGLGSYRYVIGLDKPATGASVLEQAHNDWLEWLATTGVAGAAVLALGVWGLAVQLRPGTMRRLRHEYRYPLAGAAFALVATGLHEMIGFGLQTPLNRYLLAAWIGVVWGLVERRDELARSRGAPTGEVGDGG